MLGEAECRGDDQLFGAGLSPKGGVAPGCGLALGEIRFVTRRCPRWSWFCQVQCATVAPIAMARASERWRSPVSSAAIWQALWYS